LLHGEPVPMIGLLLASSISEVACRKSEEELMGEIRRQLAARSVLAAALVLVGGLVVGGGFVSGASGAGGVHLHHARHGAGGGCTLASWRGAYGYTITGSLVAPDGSRAGDVAAVGVMKADGAGHASGHDVASLNGTPVARTWTGTYTLEADCSGTFNIVTTSQPVTRFSGFIAITSHGRVVRSVDTDPGTVGTVIATRQ
jgi:hypothetical protein